MLIILEQIFLIKENRTLKKKRWNQSNEIKLNRNYTNTGLGECNLRVVMWKILLVLHFHFSPI